MHSCCRARFYRCSYRVSFDAAIWPLCLAAHLKLGKLPRVVARAGDLDKRKSSHVSAFFFAKWIAQAKAASVFALQHARSPSSSVSFHRASVPKTSPTHAGRLPPAENHKVMNESRIMLLLGEADYKGDLRLLFRGGAAVKNSSVPLSRSGGQLKNRPTAIFEPEMSRLGLRHSSRDLKKQKKQRQKMEDEKMSRVSKEKES